MSMEESDTETGALYKKLSEELRVQTNLIATVLREVAAVLSAGDNKGGGVMVYYLDSGEVNVEATIRFIARRLNERADALVAGPDLDTSQE